jgi:hypothetical protein
MWVVAHLLWLLGDTLQVALPSAHVVAARRSPRLYPTKARSAAASSLPSSPRGNR